MAGWRQVVLTLVAVLVTSIRVSTLDIGGVKLADRLMNIADVGLGRIKIQNFCESKASFNSRLPRGKRGHEIVKTLAESVGSRFNVFNDICIGLHQVVEKYYFATNSNSTTLPECCKSKEGSLTACFERADTTRNYAFNIPVEINEKIDWFYKNNPHIKWLYFGNEKGEFILYPVDNDRDCDDYDPRLRPWYAEASTRTPKDIVIAFDTSQKNSSLIKKAVEILLDTTNPNDRITVIKFGKGLPKMYLGSSEHSTCFSQDLALATPQNRKAFKQFIYVTDEDSHGETNFQPAITPAITKAFQYFRRAEDATKRRKLLVFFAGSDPHDVPSANDIKRVVAEENNRLGQKVVIQAFAVGKGISTKTENILRAMAESTSFITSDNTSILTGTFTRISDGGPLREQLHPYYNIFSDSSNVMDPVVTVPYFDASSIGGLVVSICLPVHSDGKLGGVSCVDAELEDIFFNVTYYHQGIDAYAFIIDNRGRTILHPLLHTPKHFLEEPVFIDISTLESDDEVSDIIKSMKSGKSGDKTFHKRLNLSGRNSEQALKAQVAHYFWAKVPDTDYSLCMVFTDRDVDITVERKPDLPDVNYIHPYMLHDEKTLCQHEKVLVTKDGSVVRFTGSAYRWLSDYVDSNDGTQKQRYDNFFTASAVDQAPELKESTHLWVGLTGEADEIWKEEASAKYDSMIKWRHLVTASGVMRVYPGANFTQYDPNVLSWYKHAMLNHGWVQVQPVEKHSSFNLMISQAVSVRSPSPYPVAVVGGEVSHTSLYAVLENLYPVCKTASCFVMDTTGSVLSHKDYTGREKHASHLFTMESSIARYLQESGHLVLASCLDFVKYRTVFSWKLALQGWFIRSESPRFELHVVPGTNLFIGITWERPTSTMCNCENLTECKHDRDIHCPCPCFEILKFNSCNNTLPERNKNAISVCSVLKTEFDIIRPTNLNTNLQNLPSCMTTMCERTSFKGECLEHGCTWCSVDGTEFPGCHHQDMCSPSTSPVKSTSNGTNVVAAAVVSILVIGVVIAVLLYFIRCSPGFRKKCSSLIWPKMKPLEDPTTVVDSGRNSTNSMRLPAEPPRYWGASRSATPEYDSVDNITKRPRVSPYVVGQLNSAMDSDPPSIFRPQAHSSGFSTNTIVPADMDESGQIMTYSTVQISGSTVTSTSDLPHLSDESRKSQKGENPSTLTDQHNETLTRSIPPCDQPTRGGPSASIYSNDAADQRFSDNRSLDLSLETLKENHNAQVNEVNPTGEYSRDPCVAPQPQSGHISSTQSSDSGLESQQPNSQTELKTPAT